MTIPLISIIIPCFNAEPFIGATIESVLAQTWRNLEIIVIDDGSTDGSWSAIQRFRESVFAIRQKRGGACRARNRGAEIASGQLLMFLDADDLLGPSALTHLVDAVSDNAGIGSCQWMRLEYVYGDWIDRNSNVSLYPPSDDYLADWLTGWFIPPCALLWTREAFHSTGGWDEELHANQDGDLVIRALLNGIAIKTVPKGTAYYRSHGTNRVSISTNIASKRNLESRIRVLEKVTNKLLENDKLANYQIAIGQAYHKLARNNYAHLPELAEKCQSRSDYFAGEEAIIGTFIHRLLCNLIGLKTKERLASTLSCLGFAKRYRRKYNALFTKAGECD